MRKSLLISIITILALIAVSVWIVSKDNHAQPVTIIKVEQGPLYAFVKAAGKVISKRETPISAKAAHQILRVHVQEGAEVSAGALLAELDAADAAARISSQQAQLNQTRAEVAHAARNLEGLRKVLQVGGVAPLTVDEAATQLKSAREREHKAAAELRSATIQRNDLQIIAPFSGIITVATAKPGQWAAPGTPLFTLVDPATREIEILVDEADAAGIAIGQQVEMSSTAFPGKAWIEEVRRIDPAIRKDGTANNVGVYTSFSDKAPRLRMGQQVDAKIRTAYRPNAIKVPFEALIHTEKETQLAIVQGGRVRLQAVTPGIEDLSHTEIIKGVRPGQEVAVAEGKKLKDGDAVTPIKSSDDKP